MSWESFWAIMYEKPMLACNNSHELMWENRYHYTIRRNKINKKNKTGRDSQKGWDSDLLFANIWLTSPDTGNQWTKAKQRRARSCWSKPIWSGLERSSASHQQMRIIVWPVTSICRSLWLTIAQSMPLYKVRLKLG